MFDRAEYQRQYRLSHKKEKAEYDKTRKAYHVQYYNELRLEALLHYTKSLQPQCSVCGNTDLAKLCLDHVNGDGTAHRKSINAHTGVQFYRWLRRNGYPSEPLLQVLCQKCNRQKQTLEMRARREVTS